MNSETANQDFLKNFLISFGGHALLVLLSFAGTKVISTYFKTGDIEIIKSAVRVDVVGMPKFTIQELKNMDPEVALKPAEELAQGKPEETKPEAEDVIKKDDLVIEESGKKKNSFLNLINDYSKKKISPTDKKKGKDKGKNGKAFETLILEGNRLSQGTALVGEYSDAENSEFAGYVQALPGKIRQFWKLPSYLLEKDLRCRIRIYLSAMGDVMKLELIESSGEKEYDVRAEKAIREAAPYPKPSENVGKRLTNSGIILGFPL